MHPTARDLENEVSMHFVLLGLTIHANSVSIDLSTASADHTDTTRPTHGTKVAADR